MILLGWCLPYINMNQPQVYVCLLPLEPSSHPISSLFFLRWLQCLLGIVLCLVAQSCLTLCDPMDCSPPGSPVHGDSPGKNTRMGCHALLQGIFPTQGWNSGVLHSRWILYHLSHQENPALMTGNFRIFIEHLVCAKC